MPMTLMMPSIDVKMRMTWMMPRTDVMPMYDADDADDAVDASFVGNKSVTGIIHRHHLIHRHHTFRRHHTSASPNHTFHRHHFSQRHHTSASTRSSASSVAENAPCYCFVVCIYVTIRIFVSGYVYLQMPHGMFSTLKQQCFCFSKLHHSMPTNEK